MIVVAPTEPPLLRGLGDCAMLPEHYGLDYIWSSGGQFHGVQRKEYHDFVSSVYDGRLAKELAQAKQITGHAMLLLEGVPEWSSEGEWLPGRGSSKWNLKSHHAYLWAVQLGGVWVDSSFNLVDTSNTIQRFYDWTGKAKHGSTNTRPGPQGAWGTVTNREWVNHLLQGLPGVGSELANRIIDRLGCPLGWTVGVDDLCGVEGIGKKTAERLIGALNG